MPLVVAFTFGKMAVENGNLLLRKSGAEPLDGLRRQRNLRYEYDGIFTVVKRMFDGLEVNFRLTGTGDTVDENRLFRFLDSRFAKCERRLLVRHQWQWFGRQKNFATEWVALLDFVGQLDETFFCELFDGGRVNPGLLAKLDDK